MIKKNWQYCCIFGLILVICGCGSLPIIDEEVKQAVERQGYKNVVFYDRSEPINRRQCQGGDTIVFECSARNALDIREALIVCVNGSTNDITIHKF